MNTILSLIPKWAAIKNWNAHTWANVLGAIALAAWTAFAGIVAQSGSVAASQPTATGASLGGLGAALVWLNATLHKSDGR